MPFWKKSDKSRPKTSTPGSPKVQSSHGQSPKLPNGDIDGSIRGGVGYPGASHTPQASAPGVRPRTLLLRTHSQLDADKGDLSNYNFGPRAETPLQTSSRLSKTLLEVLHDQNAIPYLLQHMDSQGLGHFVKFWLDANSFQASSWTRIRSQSLKTLSKSSVVKVKAAESQGQGQVKDGGLEDGEGQGQVKVSDGQGHEKEDGEGHSQGHVTVGEGHDKVKETSTNCDPQEGIVKHGAKDNHTDASNLPCFEGESGSSQSAAAANSRPQTKTDASHCSVSDDVSHQRVAAAGCSQSSNTLSDSEPNVITDAAAPSTGADCVHSQGVDGGAASDSSSTQSPVGATNEAAISNHGNTTVLPNHHGNQEGNHGDQCSDSALRSSMLKSKLLGVTQEEQLQERLRRSIAQDAVSIYTKYIAQDATHPLGVTDELRSEAISKICREDGQVDPECFAHCQEYIVDIMDREYFPGFLLSEFHCKHQIDILTGTKVHLADVLYNESAIVYFMEFMEQEDARDLLQCWLDLENFQQLLSSAHGQYDGSQAQTDAIVLYEKYFSLQATRPLGFDERVRIEVEENICRVEGPLPDCFTTPKKIVLRTIDKAYFQQFLQSELYFKYLSELINTIQTAQDVPQFRRKRAGSDASSEHSLGSLSTGSELSTKNTLLATDSSSTSHIKKALNKFAGDDLRIDNMFFNPDALWKRDQAGKMSLGKIDEAGRFVSEFDPEPDHERKRKATFFKKKRDKEQTQEEMALQIAKMIVSDITMTTQGATSVADDNSSDRGSLDMSS